MSVSLFAFRISWMGALVLMAAAFVVWFAYRAVVDTIEWFRDEILSDSRPRRTSPRQPPKPSEDAPDDKQKKHE